MHAEQETAGREYLANALTLHTAMLRASKKSNAQTLPESLPALTALLKDSDWPLREDAISAIQAFHEGWLTLEEFLESGEFQSPDALPGFRRDLSIWIVERFYRPTSLKDVKHLQPGLVQAGLGFLLYQCFEHQRERPDLSDYERLLLQYVFEAWISAVWNTKGNLISTLEEDSISTNAQLIAWFKEQDCWGWRLTWKDMEEAMLLLDELQFDEPKLNAA